MCFYFKFDTKKYFKIIKIYKEINENILFLLHNRLMQRFIPATRVVSSSLLSG